jgi:hypothetical protein
MSGQSFTTSKIQEVRRQAEERVRIIRDYGALMERNTLALGGIHIFDVNMLPHDKNDILDAICLEIVRENDEKRVEALKGGALCLANYQEGVGDQPISMHGVDLASVNLESLKDDHLKLEALAAKIAGNPDRERFETYKILADKDLADIRAMLLAAEQLRRDMPDEKKRAILG